MICLGYSDAAKVAEISAYVWANSIKRIVVISPKRFRFEFPDATHVEWDEVILYRVYYPLLQKIDNETLVVVNECLQTQKRYDLTYNCIRHYLNKTIHTIVFQYLPIIDSLEDFMILFDFDTKSRWRMEGFSTDLLSEATIRTRRAQAQFSALPVAVGDKMQTRYVTEKRRLIDTIGARDPHTIPRNLYLLSGIAKASIVDPSERYVGRNNRYKLKNLLTYSEVTESGEYLIFELPHNFGTFSGFMAIARQEHFRVLVSDLKVDHWYFNRFQEWSERVANAYTKISQ